MEANDGRFNAVCCMNYDVQNIYGFPGLINQLVTLMQ